MKVLKKSASAATVQNRRAEAPHQRHEVRESSRAALSLKHASNNA
jgi:hypothetical protein